MSNFKEVKNHLGLPMIQAVGLFKMNNPQDIFWFPTEPKVQIEIDKVIVRKTVLKKGSVEGTIKELFSTNDYKIDIEGVLTARDDKNFPVFPSTDYATLIDLLKEEDSLGIICELINDFGVGLIAIESAPIIRDGNSIKYKIKAYSDKDVLITN